MQRLVRVGQRPRSIVRGRRRRSRSYDDGVGRIPGLVLVGPLLRPSHLGHVGARVARVAVQSVSLALVLGASGAGIPALVNKLFE